MDNIIEQLINNFDFTYMLIVNVLTYIFIKVLDYTNGYKRVKVYQKRILLVISIIIVAGVYKMNYYENNIVLINSSIMAPVAWSWIFRPICNKLGVGYKQRKSHDN